MTPPLTALVEALRPIRLAVDRLQWMERGCACIVNLDDLREAAAALSAFEAEPQGWRTDWENATKDGRYISVWGPGHGPQASAVFWKNGCWCNEYGWFEPDEVTHWQPLPLPPETPHE